jgi:hypothetical protein
MTPLPVSLGDIVEVYCDHKRSGRRVRDWIEGVVVHADERMTAIQFRNDVYLTDGWMVPDRILWFNKGTEKIRQAKRGRRAGESRQKKTATAGGGKRKPSASRRRAVVRRPVRKSGKYHGMERKRSR